MIFCNKEDVLCIAMSKNNLFVATDTNNIRIFTKTGSQREILIFPHRIVTLCSSDNLLAAVYQNSDSLQCKNNINNIVVNNINYKKIYSISFY